MTHNQTVGLEAFATGPALGFPTAYFMFFNGAMVGAGAEVRINGVVHLRTRLPAGATVPIGWVAVGDPAAILPPDQHEKIWAIQKPLDFPNFVFGLDRPPEGETIMPELCRRFAAALRTHADDRAIE